MSYAKKDDQVVYGARGTFLVLADGLTLDHGPALELLALEITPGWELSVRVGERIVVRAWECRVIPRPRLIVDEALNQGGTDENGK